VKVVEDSVVEQEKHLGHRKKGTAPTVFTDDSNISIVLAEMAE
jgi:hypothetical protein